MTEKEIHQICEEHFIKNYTINNDMSIDVDRYVNLNGFNLKKIPLTFNKVNGDFRCRNNILESLEGVPKEVTGDFHCSYNKLKSLKYLPTYIGRDFFCNDNKIKTLEGCPNIISGLFDASDNSLRTLENIPKCEIFSIAENPVTQFLIMLDFDRDNINYFNELGVIQKQGRATVVILDRLNYLLQDLGKEEISEKKIRNYKVI